MAWWLFQNIVVTAGLALVVAVVCRTGRIGPVGRHALWLVVLVKFVTPPLVVWPWAAPDPLRVSSLEIRVDPRGGLDDGAVGLLEAAGFTATATATTTTTTLPAVTAGDGVGQETAANGSSSPAGVLAAVWPWLLGLWVTGSLGLLTLEGLRLTRLARRVRSSAPVTPALARRIAELSAHLGIAPVAARLLPGGAPPAVWCVGRPQLLWPAELPADVSEACVDGLLLHELAHVKRRDHLVGWVELAAGIIWWWNPLFWYVRSALREQAELACDGWVVSALPNGRRAYAESLLTLSGAAMRHTPSMAIVGIRATSRRVLERRLIMIMQGRAPLHLTRAGLLSLALVAAATLPGWASATQDPPPPPPPTVPAVYPTRAVATPVAPPPSATAPRQTARRTQPPSAPPAIATPGAQMPVRVGVQTPVAGRGIYLLAPGPDSLPDDGQALVAAFEIEREVIEREIQQRIETKRRDVVAALEALQDRYTREGKLDEAVALRDYLRAGQPAASSGYVVTSGGRGGRGGRGRGGR